MTCKTQGDLDRLDPAAGGTLYLCSGDLWGIGLPCALFGLHAESFAVVDRVLADRLGFNRQGLEPVVGVATNAAQAWVLSQGLGEHRWAFLAS
jgi:hypothetical protein